MKNKTKIAYLVSHPVQYYSPLFKEIESDGQFDLTVWYCSNESLKTHFEKDFGVAFKWDTDLMSGYKSIFLKNHSFKPSIFSGFFGLMNLGVIKKLFVERPEILIVHGWHRCTNILAIFFAFLLRIKIVMRSDNPLSHETDKSSKTKFIKKIILGTCIFPWIDYFFYVGNQNKLFYQHYGVKEEKIRFAPHAVDTDFFVSYLNDNKDKINTIKAEQGVAHFQTIFLFVGKFIPKKAPLDCLTAFVQMKGKENACLLMVGDGQLKKTCEEFVQLHKLEENVRFVGFKNQLEIPVYYLIADSILLPSGHGETWGLVINEAENFGLVPIVSDKVGCADDLVQNGYNGFVFPYGDINSLTNNMEKLAADPPLLNEMKRASKEKIKFYNHKQFVVAIKSIL